MGGDEQRRRVLAVALDGTEPSLVQALLDRGDLPVLAGLLAAGRWVTLHTDAALSDVATWASIATGWDVDRHGWVDVNRLDPDTYELARLFREDVAGTPFWQHVSDAGRTVTVLDLPKVPMGRDLRGLELADWLSHMPDRPHRPITEPPEALAAIVARHGPAHGPECSGSQDLLAEAAARARRSTDLILDQVAARDADLVVAVLGSGHCVGHARWDQHRGPAPGDPLADHYRLLDGLLGEVLAAAGPGWTTLVFSARGMTEDVTRPDLTEDVLARIQGESPPAARRHRVVAAWRRLVPLRVRRALPDRWHRAARRSAAAARAGRPWFAVPTGSRAGGVRVNLVGREAGGVVDPADLDATLDRVAAVFECLVDADTGAPAVEWVQRSRDRWSGPFADRLPDLFVHWSPTMGRGVRSEAVGEIRRERPGPRSGHHTDTGWLVATGPGVAPGPALDGVDPRDLGVTIGALLGVPIPDSDGTPVDLTAD